MIAEFNLITNGIVKSKQLLSLAKAEDWEQFAALDAQRQLDLAALNLETLELTPDQHAKVHSKMEELIDLNSQLETICLKQRAKLMQQSQKISQGNKVTKAYSQ